MQKFCSSCGRDTMASLRGTTRLSASRDLLSTSCPCACVSMYVHVCTQHTLRPSPAGTSGTTVKGPASGFGEPERAHRQWKHSLIPETVPSAASCSGLAATGEQHALNVAGLTLQVEGVWPITRLCTGAARLMVSLSSCLTFNGPKSFSNLHE